MPDMKPEQIVMTTRFEGVGGINVAIERLTNCKTPERHTSCRIKIEHANEGFPGITDDTIWLENHDDLKVLHAAIGSYLEMQPMAKQEGGVQ